MKVNHLLIGGALAVLAWVFTSDKKEEKPDENKPDEKELKDSE